MSGEETAAVPDGVTATGDRSAAVVGATAEGRWDDMSATADSDNAATSRRRTVAVTVLVLVPLVVFTGWLGVRAFRVQQNLRTDAMYLTAAQQGALNLANVSAASVDSDVQRLIDSSTGSFLADFQQRKPAFVDFVRKAQSRSQATVRDAGVQSADSRSAQVLVVLGVKVAAGAAGQDDPPRTWRLRITVTRDDFGMPKMSNVEFVP